MTKYVLPDLTYDYGALEPHISGKIMQLHHDKHHKGYVDGANAALEQLEGARQKNDFARIVALEESLAFNLSGHVLHSLFWKNLAPNAGGEPTGKLASQIGKDFGGFNAFKSQLTKAAATCMGSGWGALVFDTASQTLLTAQFHDHESQTPQGGLRMLAPVPNARPQYPGQVPMAEHFFHYYDVAVFTLMRSVTVETPRIVTA